MRNIDHDAARGCEFQCIGDQIDQNLMQGAHAAHQRHRGARIDTETQIEPLVARLLKQHHPQGRQSFVEAENVRDR